MTPVTTPGYLIAASPLTKLFMRAYQQKCEENPEFFKDYDDGKGDPFEIIIPRTTGAIKFTYNKPVHFSKIATRHQDRKRDEYTTDDMTLVNWLTGGAKGDGAEETDIYGVVQLSVDLDIASALLEVTGLEDSGNSTAAKKTFDDVRKELSKNAKTAMEKARELADWRVKRALRATHQNLMKQYETMRTDGKVPYTPSVTEAVGACILADELNALDERRKKMLSRFDTNMRTNLG